MAKPSGTTVLLFSAFLLLSSAARADCPPCYNNQQPLEPRWGEQNGRRIIKVGIAVGPSNSTWSDPPGAYVANKTIANAAAAAMNMWNTAKDDEGNTIPYVFDTNPGTNAQPTSNFDIVIAKMPRFDEKGNENYLAEMETGGSAPYKLYIREDMLQKMGDSDLAAMIAHELGHRIGLSNSDSTTCNSIMRNAFRREDGTYGLNYPAITANEA